MMREVDDDVVHAFHRDHHAAADVGCFDHHGCLRLSVDLCGSRRRIHATETVHRLAQNQTRV
jgi:hypothetical protein